MNIAIGRNYKVIETEHALIITADNANVRGGQPLILAPSQHLIPYLDRYIREREAGLVEARAHELAMREANILHIIPKGSRA